MALSTELINRLERSDEPLSKRLKLAENAYCSADLAITCKENLIVKWLCKAMPLDSIVWKTLNLCMHCRGENNRNLLNNEVKTQLVGTVIDRLKLECQNVTDEIVLDCCNWVLSDPGMQIYFQSVLHIYGRLLSSVFVRIRLDSLKKSAADDEAVKLSDAELTCVTNAIESVVQMYKQHSQKDQVAGAFLDHVLSPLCTLIDPDCSDNSNRIGAEAYKCMQQVLFGKSRHVEYEEYSQGKEGAYLPGKFFTTLDKLVKNAEADHITVMLSCVFRAVTHSYRSNSALIDYFFRNLIDSVSEFKTEVANSLITYLADVNLQFENKIADITLTQYLGNLIEDTLRSERLSSEDYKLLRNITGLNALIMENKLSAVFKRILLENRSSESDQQSYVSLMTSILDASSRLRREQKLIPWLLLALQAALTENGGCELSVTAVFPLDFTRKFTALVGSLQSSQIIAMLKSLTFHLKSNCVDGYGETAPLMAECTVELLVSFFNGIRIFEHSVPLVMQKKFASALEELSTVLAALKDKILKTKHDGRIIIILLEAVLSWSQVQSLLDYYAPNSEAGSIQFPISDDDMKQLIQGVQKFGDTNCKTALNNFLLHRAKVNIIHEIRPRLPVLVDELENCWSSILKDYTELIPLLNIDQLSELADMILRDIVKSKNNLGENWEKILGADNVQENERFVSAILCQSLTKIGLTMKGSISAAITSRIDFRKILDDNGREDAPVPALDHENLIEIIPELSNLSKNHLSKIEKYLQALLYLPLRHLSTSLRTMTFVTIYVIGKECNNNERIRSLCDNILFETLEEGGLKISEFIDSASLIPSLPGSRILQKVFETSIRSADSLSLTNLVDFDEYPDEAVPVVLSCIENIKSKLNNAQKVKLSQVEKKLGKQALNILGKDAKFADKTRSVTSALKIAIGRNNVKKKLKKQVIATLESAFMDDDLENCITEDDREEMVKSSLDLAVVALQHRARFDLSEELIAGIWRVVLKHPEPKLLTPLLDASIPKVFSEVLASLLTQSITELRGNDIVKLNKTLSIWHCIVKTDMGAQRNKSRLNVTRKLVQTFEMLEIKSDYLPSVVKLLQAMINSKHMQLSGGYIDVIVMVAAKSLREGNSLAVCDKVLELCLCLLKSRNEMMLDRLQTFLFLYRPAITLIKNEAKKENGRDETMLGLCVLNLEKVTSALIKLKRHMARLSPYLLTDVVLLFAEGDLPPLVKEPFKNFVNSLMSICDNHGMALIRRALPTANSEIFKELSTTYNKFHRFTGKI